MKKIGFIGTGVMGSAIVKHLLAAGYQVNVYNRTKAKTAELVELGALWQDSPQAITVASEIIFTMVGYPQDVEETYYGEKGIFGTEVTNKTLIDMTTSTPSLAEKIAKTAKEKGAFSLDAPVSG
uniref:NAD(P)-dependent oxidoreductase n=1 Tax=Vagococcus salmoninarum TaxID=2739 RepID=UPI0028D16F83